MLETLTSTPQGLSEANLSHPPTRKSFAPYGRSLGLVMTGWDGECTFRSLSGCGWYLIAPSFDPAYMRIYDSIVKVIEELNPGLVIVDSLLNAGLDACHSLNRKFVLNSPNCPIDVARTQQPWLKGFWYYPMFVFTSNSIPKLQLSFSSFDQDRYRIIVPDPMEGYPNKHHGHPCAHVQDGHISRGFGTRQVPQRARSLWLVTHGSALYSQGPHHLSLRPRA